MHLRNRYFNPTIGQFFNLDLLEGNMDQPMSLDRYAYVQGNVVNAVDPSGNCSDPLNSILTVKNCLDEQEQLKNNLGITLTTDSSLSPEKDWTVARVHNVFVAVTIINELLGGLTRRAVGDTELRLIPGNPYGPDGAARTSFGDLIEMRVQDGTFSICPYLPVPGNPQNAPTYKGGYNPCIENIIHEFGHIITLGSHGRIPTSETPIDKPPFDDMKNRPVALWAEISNLAGVGPTEGWISSLRQNLTTYSSAELVADMFMMYAMANKGYAQYGFFGDAGQIRQNFMDGTKIMVNGKVLTRKAEHPGDPDYENSQVESAGLIGWVQQPRFKTFAPAPQPTPTLTFYNLVNRGTCL